MIYVYHVHIFKFAIDIACPEFDCIDKMDLSVNFFISLFRLMYNVVFESHIIYWIYQELNAWYFPATIDGNLSYFDHLYVGKYNIYFLPFRWRCCTSTKYYPIAVYVSSTSIMMYPNITGGFNYSYP